jgi:hypothetical protein
MSLLAKLTKLGSIFTSTNGTTPDKFDPNKSNLNPQSLIGSELDLDGKTPPKYVDNLPK